MPNSKLCSLCSVDGCGKPVFVKKLCKLHYGRQWRGQSLHRVLLSKPERFRRHFQQGTADECWLWQSGKDKNGYGLFTFRGDGTVRATRYMWEITHGEAPGRMQVCHRCDNPSCVNPAHLFLGTNLDNHLDMMSKGRWAGSPTTKLTPADVAAMRSEFSGRYGDVSRLARKFGISYAQAGKIIRGDCWKNDQLLALTNAQLERQCPQIA